MSDQDVGKLGVQQWIRDKVVVKLEEVGQREDQDPVQITREIEIYLHKEFKKEVDETLKDLMDRVEGNE